jgi:hypothetical protein
MCSGIRSLGYPYIFFLENVCGVVRTSDITCQMTPTYLGLCHLSVR